MLGKDSSLFVNPLMKRPMGLKIGPTRNLLNGELLQDDVLSVGLHAGFLTCCFNE